MIQQTAAAWDGSDPVRKFGQGGAFTAPAPTWR